MNIENIYWPDVLPLGFDHPSYIIIYILLIKPNLQKGIRHGRFLFDYDYVISNIFKIKGFVLIKTVI